MPREPNFSFAKCLYAFGGAAAIALLASCSNGSSVGTLPAGGGSSDSMSSLRQPGGANPSEAAVGTTFGGVQFPTGPLAPLEEKAAQLPDALVYVSYPSQLLVAVYDSAGKSLGNIGYIALPRGLFVDSRRNLWVTQESWFTKHGHIFPQMPTVLEFKRGDTTPSKTLRDPAGYAFDVTMCPSGTVYVANEQSISGGKGNIQVYAGGSTKPTGSLTYPEGFYDFSVTCDAAGNVFTSMVSKDVTHGFVVEYPGGNQSGAAKIINNVVPFGVKPDNAGNLLVDDLSSVCEYTEAGKPTGTCVNVGGNWYFFALRQDGKAILGANFATSVTNSFQFPGGGLGQVYPGYNNPEGTAYDPGQDI